MADRIYRSRSDRVLAGVAGGLAERFDLDPSLVRVAWVVLAILSGGIFVLIYIVMAIVVPESPTDRSVALAPGPGAVPGWVPPPGTTAAAPTGEVAAGSANTASMWSPASAGAGQAASAASVGAGRRPGNAGIVVGVVLIGLGVWFLLDRWFDIDIEWDLVWPVVVIILGAALIAGAVRRRERT